MLVISVLTPSEALPLVPLEEGQFLLVFVIPPLLGEVVVDQRGTFVISVLTPSEASPLVPLEEGQFLLVFVIPPIEGYYFIKECSLIVSITCSVEYQISLFSNLIIVIPKDFRYSSLRSSLNLPITV